MRKVLNLYAGIGGNRKLWKDVEVTAVELNPEIAKIYQDFFPDDKVIVADAHQYLLSACNEGLLQDGDDAYWDFVWSSPPCPTHGQYRYNIGVKAKGFDAVYPDMKLYEEIILMKYHVDAKWAIENTISYYEPFIQPQKVGRHFVWSNFEIQQFVCAASGIGNKSKISDFTDYDLTKYKIPDKRQILRNCVNPELGLHIFNMAFKHKQHTLDVGSD
ncbi:MAG: DNA cytosine methyltransferase [Bacteroidales bacterium]|nr:DNA cytosine methyltransferase [Bacteroidales bacterium]